MHSKTRKEAYKSRLMDKSEEANRKDTMNMQE